MSAGILTHDELRCEISSGRLITGTDAAKVRIRGCSVDLTVGTIFRDGRIIPWHLGEAPVQITVPPGGVVGLFTLEELDLPLDYCATAFAINALSSKGFLVLNPGHVDPGFKGPLTVKALNVRKTPIAIHQGEPIFTVIVQRIGVATVPYSNVPRDERERDFNARAVETSPRALSNIIEADEGGPFPGRHEINEIIRTHWMSRWTFVLTVAAAVFSALAVVASLAPLWKAPPATQHSASAPALGGDSARTLSGDENGALSRNAKAAEISAPHGAVRQPSVEAEGPRKGSRIEGSDGRSK